MNYNVKRILSAALILTLLTTLLAVPALAAGGENEYARNMAAWVLDGIYWLALVGIIWGIFKCVISRNLIAGVSLFVVGALVIAFIVNPELIKTLGQQALAIAGFST